MHFSNSHRDHPYTPRSLSSAIPPPPSPFSPVNGVDPLEFWLAVSVSQVRENNHIMDMLEKLLLLSWLSVVSHVDEPQLDDL